MLCINFFFLFCLNFFVFFLENPIDGYRFARKFKCKNNKVMVTPDIFWYLLSYSENAEFTNIGYLRKPKTVRPWLRKRRILLCHIYHLYTFCVDEKLPTRNDIGFLVLWDLFFYFFFFTLYSHGKYRGGNLSLSWFCSKFKKRNSYRFSFPTVLAV